MVRPRLGPRRLEAERAVAGPQVATTFRGDPRRWLPPPARPRGVDRYGVALRAGRLTRTVPCEVGPPWTVGDTIWRALAWIAAPERADVVPVEGALPRFHGELGLRTGEGGATLLLRGHYRPPAGVLGAAADAVGLHRVAETTAACFVSDVATRLEADTIGRHEAPG